MTPILGTNIVKHYSTPYKIELGICGKNNEFHTFVYDTPYFKWQIKITQGKIIQHDNFIFTD